MYYILHISLDKEFTECAWLSFFCTDAAVDVKDEIYMKDSKHPTLTSEEEVLKDLEAAKLEDVGFTRIERKSVEITTDGKRVEKRVIGFFKRVKCSEEKEARNELEKRLPKHLFSRELNKDVDKEVKKETTRQEICKVGIEAEVPRTGRKRFFFFGFGIFIGFGFFFG